MAEHIYKVIELVGTSHNSLEEAVQNAIARAAQTIHNMRWFEVVETRGNIEGDHVGHWQVKLKIGFTLDEQ
ncbi:MAG: dodecin domain-containing protein [Calditrichaeota bacterium]|nr:MAG: dodecin domain-containing protein [Calditrichota bacterium]